MMMTERGMAAPAIAGSVLAEFDTILAAVVPELAGRVQAVAFDAEIGRLDVVPDLPAAGAQLRWRAPKLVAAANERVRGANVPHSVRSGTRTRIGRPRHGGRRTGPAADCTCRTDAARGYA
ncbi:hypothetical protein AB0N60_35970 [Streptomyces microflavus]|uniref:hypothetical protein n=1 Tax=Streptomyces microflavus TaxID=1919 RepID=UPI00341A1A24